MSILAYAVIAFAIFAAGAAGGWKAHVGIIASRDLAAVQAQERETLRRTDKIDKSAVKHEVAKAKLDTEFLVITEKINVITKEPFYTASPMCLDDSGLQLIADSIKGSASAASQPAPALPRPKPPG